MENNLYDILKYMCQEYPEYADLPIPDNHADQFRLYRHLVNIRPPRAVSCDYRIAEDAFLQGEAKRKGIVSLADMESVQDGIYLWQGDITRLAVDAIVNAANDRLLGCFLPGHACIDNAIHTYAGTELRLACHELMKSQGYPEPTGCAKITSAFNLPSRYVLHTIGPIIHGGLKKEDCDLLAACYLSCLDLAEESGLESIAFCCISTGEFRFPREAAAKIAVQTVKERLSATNNVKQVVFNVFKDEDYAIYEQLLAND